MLAGIGPILGEGPAGGIVDKDGTLSQWSYVGGQAVIDGEMMMQPTIPPYHLHQEMPPVAVLTSSSTVYGGEALAISFKNRPDTSSFGDRTGGYGAFRTCLPLDDGAVVCVTSHLFVDRTGLVYGMALDSDVSIEMTGEIPQEAIDWLLSQPACSTP
jgi:C-terminal processing protease CtpA/Prc